MLVWVSHGLEINVQKAILTYILMLIKIDYVKLKFQYESFACIHLFLLLLFSDKSTNIVSNKILTG